VKRTNRSVWPPLAGVLEVAICAALLAPAATATPVYYTIIFSTSAGIAPDSGYFQYDSAQPAGSQFSSFLVAWGGYNFDLTASANAPLFINNSGACTNDVFAFLNTGYACSSHLAPAPEWSGTQALGVNFLFVDESAIGSDTLRINDHLGISTGLTGTGHGEWTIAQGTPEPASFVLALTGALLLLFGIKKSPEFKRT
jgi:hypothetical protein